MNNGNLYDVNRDGFLDSNDIRLSHEIIEMNISQQRSESHRSLADKAFYAMALTIMVVIGLPITGIDLDMYKLVVSASTTFIFACASLIGGYFGVNVFLGRRFANGIIQPKK